MIVKERFSLGGRDYVNTQSDCYMYIEREDGLRFASAADLADGQHSYTETEERLFSDEELEQIPQDVAAKVRAAYAKNNN